ncbi:MAG: hypothetical protein AAFZ80_00615 [Cyanobacteria bacterium P01_A01_bin.105]
MTKKRIADLLKEEVEKSAESAAEPSAETVPEVKPKRTPRRSTRKTRGRGASAATQGKSGDEATPASAVTVEVEAKALDNKALDTGALDTKTLDTKALTNGAVAADISVAAEILKNRITDLERQLAAANQKMVDLQADVTTHQNRVYELKDSLDVAQKAEQKKAADLEKVKAELKAAKDTIRQLTVQPSVAQAESPAKPAEQPAAQKPAHTIMGADLARNRRTFSARRPPTPRKSIPDYAILRDGQQNSMLSDDDIGWVD